MNWTDAAGLRGEGVSEFVVQAIRTMTEHHVLLDLSLFTFECINYSDCHNSLSSPASLLRRGSLLMLRVASRCSSTPMRTRTSVAPLAPRSVSNCHAGTYGNRQVEHVGKVCQHLPSTFSLPDSVNSSMASTRSRAASVATELMPASWPGRLLSWRRSRRPGRGGRGG